MNLQTAVNNIPLLQAAGVNSLNIFLSHAVMKHVKKGKYLFLEQDESSCLYFLAKGTAVLYKLSSVSDRRVVFICGVGELLNEEMIDGKSASASCELLSDSWILCIDRQEFLMLLSQDFPLTKTVMESMSLKIRRMYHQMKNTVSTIRVDKKIAAKLWKLSKDHGKVCKSGVMINFDLSVTLLADMLGAKRETVSRRLKLLTEEGLVVMEDNRFIIPDPCLLRKYCEHSNKLMTEKRG